MTDIVVGDRVQYITDIEWGPPKGLVGVVTHVYSDGTLLVRPIGELSQYLAKRREIRPIPD